MSQLSSVFTWDVPRAASLEKQRPDTNRKQVLQEGGQAKVTFPSNQQFLDQRDKIGKLEQELVTLQMEKQRLETEYARVPQSAGARRKREALEEEIDLVYKTVNTVK